MERKTRIVCTIGPSSDDEETLLSLLRAGMDVARLNFSHGTQPAHETVFRTLRRLAEAEAKHVPVLQDLCGPKIRLGEMACGVEVAQGQEYCLTSRRVLGDGARAEVTYDHLAEELSPGDRVLIDDGQVEMRVEALRPPEVVCTVLHGGELRSHKGVNLPGVQLSVPAVTEKDESDLRFGLRLGVDLVALSFVRRADDLRRVRDIMAEEGILRPVIVKVEKGEALGQLEEIVLAADGVMVARGDLGIEVALEDVPLIQKDLIRLCIKHARPVITATQMLESMVENPRPTRAEVNDVANAIIDGTDAVMLSGETAAGRFPVKSVEVMSRVALRTEQSLDYAAVHRVLAPQGQPVDAVALAACEIAEEVGARAILACTRSGRTVRAISRYRPRSRILGITCEPETARQLPLSWGVTPLIVNYYDQTEELMGYALEAARGHGYVGPGDMVVMAAGVPAGSPTNLLLVRQA